MTKPITTCGAVLAALVSSALVPVAHAQVDEKRPSFFEGNYAKGVAETGTAAPQTATGPKKFELDLSAAPPDIQKSMREYMQARQIPGRDFPPPMVLVVVNSKDAEHLNRVVQKALSLDTKGIVHISDITHIGDYRTLSEDLAVKLRARKIPYKADTTAPLGLPVTRSPAWVFLGPAGARIVEGTLDLEQYVTPLGQYKDPRWVDSPSRGSGEVKGF
jgi:hypothetical protein